MDLQAEIDRQAGSGFVQLEAGTYMPSSTVVIPSNCIVQGRGYATKICLPAGIGITQNGGNTIIRDLLINADQHIVNDKALLINNPHDVTVERCYILNCGGFGIFVTTNEAYSGKVRIINNRLCGKGNNDVVGGGPINANSNLIDLIITGNYIRQQISPSHIYQNALDIVSMQSTIIEHNIIEGSLLMGGEKVPHANSDISHNLIRPAIGASDCQVAILAASNAGETDISHDLKIIGNDIQNGQIYAQGQASTGSRTSRVIIDQNTIKGLKNHPDPDHNRAIDLNFMSDVIVDHNIIYGAGCGIYYNNVQNLSLGINRMVDCTLDQSGS